MSPAACAGSPPGPRSAPRGAARLLCAVSCGSGLAVAERMEHQTSTDFVGVQVGRVLRLEAADLEAVCYGALPNDVGFGACGAVLTPFFADQELAPRLGGLYSRGHRPGPGQLATIGREGQMAA